MADEGKNIRSVIKNSTMWGMSVKGSGNTIATKNEINQSKAKPETPKISFWPKIGLQTPILGWLNVWLNLNKAQSTGKSEVVSQPKVKQWGQSTVGGMSISQQPPVSSPFQNQMNEPINNINVEQFNNESILKRITELNLKKEEKPITERLKELDKERNKRMSKGIENLYIDAYNKWVDGWMLTIEDVLGNKNYQQQLKGIDEKKLAEMIDDANYLAQWDYDTQNVLALMDKYKDLWLKMDLDSLPPQTKAQYIAANLEGNDGGLAGVIDHISPLNIPGEIIERVGGTNPRDYNEKIQQWAQENKHDFLSNEELKYVTQDFVKNLDKEYKDYYYNQTEEMFTDKRIGEQFYEDVAKLRKKNKGMSEEEAVEKVMKEWKYNGVAYEKFQHETVDQWRFWNDKGKEKEYNKRLKEIEWSAKKAHWDTTANWIKNLWLDATLVVGQGLDLVRNPWSLASWLASAVKGAWHKAIEWYADLLDTVIATAETVVDKDKKWEGIQYRVGEVWEKVAKKKWYENYDAMVQKMEQASEDNPWLKVATWFLKQGEKDLGTANAFGDYLTNAYGSWDRVEQTAKENPVQMASDIISIIQLGTMWAAKMWLIDANKANQIVKVAGYGDLYEQTLKWWNKAQFWPVLRGEMAVAKAWAKVVWVPFKVAKNFTEVFVNKLSWLTKEERDFIKQNPEKVEEFLKWDKNSQSLLDRIIERFDGLQLEKRLEGEEYEKIKNSNTPVKISDMLSSISERLKKGGLELTNEWVRVNKNYTPAINSKFTELGAFLDELRKKWNSATAEDVRWARRQIDTLAKWEWQPAGLEADAIGLIRDIRGILDAELKRQIPDMKVLDDSYRATIAEVKEMKKDWFNKDGTLKDSAYSRIRNLTNKGSNQPKLARLERLLPWISEELRGLAVAESVEKAGKQMVGQYANQIFGVGGWIVGITSLLSGWLSAWPIILGVLWATLATPKNLVKLLKYQGKISKWFDNIISKITKGIKLTPAETQEFTKYLNDNQRELGKDARYMYEKGLITDEEYKAALEKEEKDYNMAVDKARASVWDKEKTLKGKEGEKVIEDTKKKAKNIWFVTEIEKGLKDENGGKVLGLADVKNKIIKLSKNLTDTTAQHELFHAVMSVVDGKTRKYVIDEAKKILKDRGISDVNAEEWLAESFGVYAKRKQVNLGVLDKVKWGDWKIRAVIGDLFQRVYEWLQNYNGDRKTINKLFDEILDDKVKIGENGGVDLSYLLEWKDLEGKWLKGKDWLRYKKDLSNKDSRGRSLSEGQVEYFKNSKARDKDGNLIRVYHWTSNKFNVFDENKIDKKGNYFGAWFYFTDDVESAGAYGGLVKEWYLNIEKMFDMSKYYTEAEYNWLLRELWLSKDELPAYKTKEGEYHLVSWYERDTFRRMGDNSYNFDWERLTEALKKAGYDWIMWEIWDEREFVVFNSNQFKNVDNLNPTKNKDIRYKRAKDSDIDGVGKWNGEKELKMTWKWEKNEYNNKDNLDINQKNKDGVIKESKNDTWKGEKNLWWLAKKEKGVEQWWVWQKTSWQARNDGWRIPQEDWGYLEINTDWAKVVENLEKIKASNPDWFKMDIHWSDDYGNGKRKTFQSKDGLSSVTVKEDGDITSLVSKPWLKRGKELVLTAIKNWGDKLDCYEEYLPTMYQNWGFEPVARVKFNPEYAPADWKGKWQDIIVMMRRNNDSVEKVNENWWRYEKVDLDDLPVMEYDDALAYRDMLLEERKKSYKPRKVETVQETPNWLKKKKEWVWPNKPIWEETINKDTWKPYTAEEVDAKMNKIKDKYLNDKDKLRKLYNKYVEVNDELGEDLQNTFMKDGYLNPDGLRPLINKEFAREMWVGDNVMASTNHPAVSKIADAFVEMVGDDMVEKASKWEKVNVALIWGWGWSWKSGWPKAMISEGFVKDGEKVNMTLDVQGGANDVKKLIEKAREKWVLDKFNFKIAYVYASTEDAGKWVINRTINQNQRILEKQWLSPKVVEKETDIGKNRLYAWRTLPFEVFEQGHLKSVWEKWLRGYIDIAKDIDNVEFMITERIPWDKKNTNKYVVKQGGEWGMTEKELNDLVTRMTKNKEAWLNWAELEKEWQKAVKEGKISKRQYANLFGRLWAFAFLLMVVGWWNGEEA